MSKLGKEIIKELIALDYELRKANSHQDESKKMSKPSVASTQGISLNEEVARQIRDEIWGKRREFSRKVIEAINENRHLLHPEDYYAGGGFAEDSLENYEFPPLEEVVSRLASKEIKEFASFLRKQGKEASQ